MRIQRSTFFILFFANLLVNGQYLDIREKIKPLRSSRSEVSRIGRHTESHPLYERYETTEAFIDVEYSEANCLWHGWNVPPGTVLAFNVYPKHDVSLNDVELSESKFIKTVDDSSWSYFSNKEEGIQYAVKPDGEVSYIRHSPSAKESSFRCTGFPPFEPAADVYVPLHKSQIKNPSRWDVGLLGGFFIMLSKESGLNGTIIVYGTETKPAEVRILMARVAEFARTQYRMPKDRLKVVNGGNRDAIELEAFALPKNYPPPVPKPKYPRRAKR